MRNCYQTDAAKVTSVTIGVLACRLPIICDGRPRGEMDTTAGVEAKELE